MTWRGLSVCLAIDARQCTMLSSSSKAGMTTSTTASCQSSAGVGTVLSGPRSSPMVLSSALGLRTNQGAVAISLLFRVALSLDRDQFVDRAFQSVLMLETGEGAQLVQCRTATADVFKILAVGFLQRHVLDFGMAAGARDHELGELEDADLAVVADVDDLGIGADATGERVERYNCVARIAERTRLLTAAEHGDRLVRDRLRDEARHHP